MVRYTHLRGRPLIEELDNIQQWTAEPTVPTVILDEMHAAPGKPQLGMMVLADGTDSNPGSGQGVYVYYGSAWNFLG